MGKWVGDTFISHAFGIIDDCAYTNSLEAFESNYTKGHRTFEVDLYLTWDEKVVLAHDWNHNARIQKRAWTEQVPPTEEEFKSAKIYSRFTPMSYTDLLRLMKDHPEIWIITDTKYTDKERMEIQFHYMVDTAVALGMADILDRLVIQIYNEGMYHVVNGIHPFCSYIFTLYQRWDGDSEELKKICRWCMEIGIDTITMPVTLYSKDIQNIVEGINVYVHTQNNVLEARNTLKSGIRGIYTDSLSAMDLNFINVYREQRKQNKKRKRYEKIIKGIIRQKEMISCAEWIRRENKKVVIFGAGTYGHQIYDILKRQGIDTALFCDNKKCGGIDKETGIRVVDVAALKEQNRNYLILLCVVDKKAYISIENQLKEAGFDSGQLRGMREYIDSLTVENLEIPDHSFDYSYFTLCFIIMGTAVAASLYWHGGLILLLYLFGALFLVNSTDWLMKIFGKIEFRTILFQLHSPPRGTGREIIKKYCLCIRETLIETTIVTMLYCLSGRMGVPQMNRMFVLFALLAMAMIFLHKGFYKIGMPEYIRQMSKRSKLYEEEYVTPDSVRITFPGKKKNLIYIYLESMEMTNAFMDIGGEANNLIPHLTSLASEHISFSNKEDLGGAQQMPGTGWTMAGIMASTAGISYILPTGGNDNDKYYEFLPKLESLGDILGRNGYKNYFMCGSDAAFAGRDLYFRTHGDYEIFDLIQARKDGIIPEKYNNGFWGMEDSRLYGYAKCKLTEISQMCQPFNFTMLTVDTHHVDGYLCDKCPQKYPQKYANVISCADNQIYDFLKWVQEQQWYKDTVVVITGDHLSMVKEFYEKYSGVRAVYNCFMNTPFVKGEINENFRDFWMADFFPSTLGALGANIEGNQLGLGVNLFSSKKTLAEKMGIEKLSTELGKDSMFYKRFI